MPHDASPAPQDPSRKRDGAYYTPEGLAAMLVRAAVRAPAAVNEQGAGLRRAVPTPDYAIRTGAS